MKNPRNLNVLAEIEGKMAERVSPNSTTSATLYGSASTQYQVDNRKPIAIYVSLPKCK